MEKDTRYEIIIQALCVYAEKLEQSLRDAAKPQTKWLPVAADEVSPELLTKTLRAVRHNVTAKRGPGRPRKNK